MSQTDEKKAPGEQKKRRSRWRRAGIVLLFLVILFTAARLAMPYAVRWYVNRTINQTQLYEGRIGPVHIRAFHRDPPVDVYLSQLDASIENLTNIRSETAPLVTTINASAMAMDQAKLEYQMKLDPFSYYPSFDLAVRLLGLDVTKTN